MTTKRRGRPLKGQERMSTRMGFRIQNTMLKDILAICEDEGITRSDFITRALEKEVSRCLTNYMEQGIGNSIVDSYIRRRIK